MQILNQKSIVNAVKLALPTMLLTAGLSANAMAGQTSAWKGEANDAWIDGKIETAYTLNRYLNPFKIDTQVENGKVLLTGEVESLIDKNLAGEIAKGTDGVSEVDNQLTVKSGALKVDSNDRDFSDFVNDATLTAKVKFALLENESTNGLGIDVDTQASIVSLKGDVASPQVKELAGRIASNIEGVNQVNNQLTIPDQS